jgi:IPT/TIG domain
MPRSAWRVRALLMPILLAGCGGGTTDPPPGPFLPTLRSLHPSSAMAGTSQLTLTLMGEGFESDAVVRWAGSARTTEVVSAVELRATIGAGDLALPGQVAVTVENPSPHGGTSVSRTFTITEVITNPEPAIIEVAPTEAQVGGPGFTLTVTGTGFVASSTVLWNGLPRTTAFVSPSTITAAITADDVAHESNNLIRVINPEPGGGLSQQSISFMVYQLGDPSIRTIDLPAHDLALDPASGHLYASVGGTGGAHGNSIARIDPVSGTIVGSVFVGSEPRRLARSDDGQYLYVSLMGASAVRRYIVATATAELQFPVGSDPFFGPLAAEDIAVLPGAPGTVAIATMKPGFSPRHHGVRIYDEGVPRPTGTPDHTGSNEIEAMSATELVGANTETTEFGVRLMDVTEDGVTVTDVYENLSSGFGGAYALADGLFYTPGGTVIDPLSGQVLGTYPGGAGAVAVDLPNDRVFYLRNSAFQEDGIAVFQASTFVYLGTIPLGAYAGGTALVRWGTNGLAYISNNAVVLLTTEFLPE